LKDGYSEVHVLQSGLPSDLGLPGAKSEGWVLCPDGQSGLINLMEHLKKFEDFEVNKEFQNKELVYLQ